MRNMIISFSLFVVMILTMIFSIGYLNKTCKSLLEDCDKLEEDIAAENWNNIYEDSIDFLHKVQKDSKPLSIFIDHQELDNMSNELYKFTQYTKWENKEEALASLHVVKFYINHIQELQKINAQNIF
ncbi:DUF4363 family protein [Clostridium algidicarnis]|uniref:Uncharacterized protein DUF4363 n=2 Tax=Clostridium algidicarnis TaxID=37659 RepID=A0A2S6G020_9CLOT|nr:DUF4363 family protein [Clostridium algidicarnis]MBB6630848.1 DUF4363 family protein [Clostridium algidicarnis]MBB6696750.1 DUF4363 family protein [Clostridium algidicarnis]MBU3192697.1 DUF4363 family protein [Clostridium algidicarnis]MBU3204021.1 DUF4363 family protein [Clostridium algidicarnis]MBU3212175.1 DUF4363 family protein [Clostridium algidicarnis]